MIDIAPYLSGIVAAYALLILASFSPGPSVALLIGIATGHGRTPALTGTLGIAFGSMSLNVLTMLGVGLLLSEVAWAMTLLRVFCSAYLLYLAYGAFRKAMVPSQLIGVSSDARALSKHFISGYLLQVTNPKAIAFWLVISSIGAVDGANAWIVGLFIAGAFTISFVCHGVWAVALSSGTVRSMYRAGRRWIEFGLGTFFTVAALALLRSESQ